jgi:hypothetical protein
MTIFRYDPAIRYEKLRCEVSMNRKSDSEEMFDNPGMSEPTPLPYVYEC